MKNGRFLSLRAAVTAAFFFCSLTGRAANSPEDVRAQQLVSSAPYRAAVAAFERDFDRFVDELIGHPALADVHWRSEVVAGPVADVIVAAALNEDADAIYVGSRGAGRAKALLGSVAHDVLHRADRPVTVITERAAERVSAAA